MLKCKHSVQTRLTRSCQEASLRHLPVQAHSCALGPDQADSKSTGACPDPACAAAQEEIKGTIDGELAIVLSSIAVACKQIASLVTRAGISNLTGLAGAANIQARPPSGARRLWPAFSVMRRMHGLLIHASTAPHASVLTQAASNGRPARQQPKGAPPGRAGRESEEARRASLSRVGLEQPPRPAAARGGAPRAQGEDQKKLDVVSNEVFCNALRNSGRTGIIASEEEDLPVSVEETYSGAALPYPKPALSRPPGPRPLPRLSMRGRTARSSAERVR